MVPFLAVQVAAAVEAMKASTICECFEDVHYWVSAGKDQQEFKIVIGWANTFSEAGEIPVST
jgi:hypothetical protein